MNRNREDILELVEYDDLTADMQTVADIIGMEAVKKLIKDYDGMSFYVPKLTKMENPVKKYLAANKGKNCKNLARELGRSQATIRELMKEIRRDRMQRLF